MNSVRANQTKYKGKEVKGDGVSGKASVGTLERWNAFNWLQQSRPHCIQCNFTAEQLRIKSEVFQEGQWLDWRWCQVEDTLLFHCYYASYSFGSSTELFSNPSFNNSFFCEQQLVQVYCFTSHLQVGQVCCRWNQDLRQLRWKIWPQGSFLAEGATISSLNHRF